MISEWKRVAVEGDTIDKRKVNGDHIRQMAANYNRELYTANVNEDHFSFSMNYGQVVEVKAEKWRANSKMPLLEALYVKVDANKFMQQLHDAGQKLFSSIEILFEFPHVEGAYLSGLALTDEPASIGTEQWKFSKNSKSHDGAISQPIEFDVNDLFQKDDDIPAWFKKILPSFKQKENDMSKEALEKLTQKLESIDSRLSAVEGGSDGEGNNCDGENEHEKSAIEKITDSVNALTQRVEEVEKNKTQDEGEQQSQELSKIRQELTSLKADFKTALEEADDTQPGSPDGDEHDEEEQVYI